jgi:hypothetical protein
MSTSYLKRILAEAATDKSKKSKAKKEDRPAETVTRDKPTEAAAANEEEKDNLASVSQAIPTTPSRKFFATRSAPWDLTDEECEMEMWVEPVHTPEEMQKLLLLPIAELSLRSRKVLKISRLHLISFSKQQEDLTRLSDALFERLSVREPTDSDFNVLEQLSKRCRQELYLIRFIQNIRVKIPVELQGKAVKFQDRMNRLQETDSLNVADLRNVSDAAIRFMLQSYGGPAFAESWDPDAPASEVPTHVSLDSSSSSTTGNGTGLPPGSQAAAREPQVDAPGEQTDAPSKKKGQKVAPAQSDHVVVANPTPFKMLIAPGVPQNQFDDLFRKMQSQWKEAISKHKSNRGVITNWRNLFPEAVIQWLRRQLDDAIRVETTTSMPALSPFLGEDALDPEQFFDHALFRWDIEAGPTSAWPLMSEMFPTTSNKDLALNRRGIRIMDGKDA